jgi:hypothetical protein
VLLRAYDNVATNSHRPAIELAAVNQVDVDRLREWVKQARRTLEESTLDRDPLEQQERRWEEAVDQSLADQLGITWEEYCDRHDHAGADDPVGAWDFAKREAFLRTDVSKDSVNHSLESTA